MASILLDHGTCEKCESGLHSSAHDEQFISIFLESSLEVDLLNKQKRVVLSFLGRPVLKRGRWFPDHPCGGKWYLEEGVRFHLEVTSVPPNITYWNPPLVNALKTQGVRLNL